MTTKEICETVLGPIQWNVNGDGMCRCPGEKKHTHRTGRADCKVYTSGHVPTVYCFHDHCQEEIAEANSKIRDAWRLYVAEPVDEEDLKKAREMAEKKRALQDKTRNRLPAILKDYATDWNEDHNPLVWFELYGPTDVLWCGEPFETGGIRFCNKFRPMELIMRRYSDTGQLPLGQFTCPSVFGTGEFNRRNEAVIRKPYLVLEGDSVGMEKCETAEDRAQNKRNCAAVMNWLDKTGALKLRMVVDSGNRSLHGWFDYPKESVLAELKVVLPALGFDRATLKPSQPVRMPGQTRDNGNKQKIIYAA